MDIFSWMYFSFQIILCFLICNRLYPPIVIPCNYMLQQVMSLIEYPVDKYKEASLSTVSRRLLRTVPKKILVLDMDETLMTSKSARDWCNSGLQAFDYDYKISLKEYRSTYFIYKRPYVDYFLENVCKWYDVVIYTAGDELYANHVLDGLDNGRVLLRNRLFRKHCITMFSMRAKFLGIVEANPANVLIIDNSDISCGLNPENSIRIRSYRGGHSDTALLKLLPLLDALRFVVDVRSVLSRSKRYKKFSKNVWGI